MRIAIFGGTGFLGHDFVRLLLDEGGWEPVVYCTSAANLANLRRYAVDVRLVPPAKLPGEQLDPGIDTIVNFAHPFTTRESLAPNEQTDLFVRFLRTVRERNDGLRLVHVSTMSVYEPFAAGREFDEAVDPQPPPTDHYATAKLHAEKAIRALPGGDDWQLVLRPTVVYGPYCRPWTDGPLQAFADGDVRHRGLAGKIQPIWGHDISRFIRLALDEFRPGVLNLAGEETMAWMDFLKVFGDVVGKGRLVEESQPVSADDASRLGGVAFCTHHLKALYRDIVRHPSFLALGARASRPFPGWFVTNVQRALGMRRPVGQQAAPVGKEARARFAQPFFSEDRLVSRARFVERYPGFRMTRLGDVQNTLRQYYEYRFTDKLYVEGPEAAA